MSRVAIVVTALVLGIVAVPVTGAANEISDEPTCKDVNAGVAVQGPGEECFPGSTERRAAVVGLMAVSVVLAILAMIAAATAGPGTAGSSSSSSLVGGAVFFCGRGARGY